MTTFDFGIDFMESYKILKESLKTAFFRLTYKKIYGNISKDI